ncbi:hypothetical protein HALLA_00685 (plasmid) [Halostagnicola larsenii XH-48]|uniref:Uncharacterized protein n=1 Tax=Halostagnicola larsenii XH-48 TaxID=797299 RepID=W0JXA8_9EURY|nr:hypothetical protein HALLA_00685 [Halostagnicola larsenii XH-48]
MNEKAEVKPDLFLASLSTLVRRKRLVVMNELDRYTSTYFDGRLTANSQRRGQVLFRSNKNCATRFRTAIEHRLECICIVRFTVIDCAGISHIDVRYIITYRPNFTK